MLDIARIRGIGAVNEQAVLADAAVAYRDVADRLISGLRDRTSQSEATVNQLEARGAELARQLKAATLEVAQQKTRLDAAIADFQSQFSQAEDRRRQAFEVSSKLTGEKSDALLAAQRDEAEAQVERWESQAAAALETLEHKRREAVDLVHVIGNVGVTGNFKEVADAEKRAADWLRGLAIGFMVLTIAGVASTLWVAAKPETEWHQIVVRVAITVALAVPATYVARESSGHRRVERATRRLELELASIDPYLEQLPEESRHAVKRDLSMRFFGASAQDASKDDVPVSSQSDLVTVTIKELADALKRAIDQLSKK